MKRHIDTRSMRTRTFRGRGQRNLTRLSRKILDEAFQLTSKMQGRLPDKVDLERLLSRRLRCDIKIIGYDNAAGEISEFSFRMPEMESAVVVRREF